MKRPFSNNYTRTFLQSFIFLIVVSSTFAITFILNTSKVEYRSQNTKAGTFNEPTDGYGVYESCPPKWGTQCLQRLTNIAGGRVKLVINYDQAAGTKDQETAYSNQAFNSGLKIIWAMNDPAFWNGTDLEKYYPDLASSSGCKDNDNTCFITYYVKFAMIQPSTWGYYIGDEVQTTDYNNWLNFSNLVRSIDQDKVNHPRLFVAGSDNPTVNLSLNQFQNGAEVIAQDYYPIGVNQQGWTLQAAGTIAGQVQTIANQYKKGMGMVLQAHSFYAYPAYNCQSLQQCPYPTADQMSQMLDYSLTSSHPRVIIWYSYFDQYKPGPYTTQWGNLESVIGQHVPSPTATQTPTTSITQTPSPTATKTTTPTPTISITSTPTVTNYYTKAPTQSPTILVVHTSPSPTNSSKVSTTSPSASPSANSTKPSLSITSSPTVQVSAVSKNGNYIPDLNQTNIQTSTIQSYMLKNVILIVGIVLMGIPVVISLGLFIRYILKQKKF